MHARTDKMWSQKITLSLRDRWATYTNGYSNHRTDMKSMHNHCQIQQREITPKVRKAELSFLYLTCRLVLFYISTQYHQTIPKGIRVTEWTRNLFQTKQREITPKLRKPELPFLYVTSSHPILHFYQVSSKYSKGEVWWQPAVSRLLGLVTTGCH